MAFDVDSGRKNTKQEQEPEQDHFSESRVKETLRGQVRRLNQDLQRANEQLEAEKKTLQSLTKEQDQAHQKLGLLQKEAFTQTDDLRRDLTKTRKELEEARVLSARPPRGWTQADKAGNAERIIRLSAQVDRIKDQMSAAQDPVRKQQANVQNLSKQISWQTERIRDQSEKVRSIQADLNTASRSLDTHRQRVDIAGRKAKETMRDVERIQDQQKAIQNRCIASSGRIITQLLRSGMGHGR